MIKVTSKTGNIMEPEKIILSWDDYFALCDNLVRQLKDEDITDIIAIARGGLLPAQYLAYKLGVRQIYNYGISSYSDKNIPLADGDVRVYQDLIPMNFTSDGRRALIVDDIADTGRTIKRCFEHCMGRVKVATLHYKPEKSMIRPNFWASTISNLTWIVYPYEH